MEQALSSSRNIIYWSIKEVDAGLNFIHSDIDLTSNLREQVLYNITNKERFCHYHKSK